ncbi:hypothetical protein J6U76_06025 [bacterium]|nr:hypothetical protein [bacterium]
MREIKFYIPKFKSRRQRKILFLSLVVTLIIIAVLALGIKIEEPQREPFLEREPLELIVK